MNAGARHLWCRATVLVMGLLVGCHHKDSGVVYGSGGGGGQDDVSDWPSDAETVACTDADDDDDGWCAATDCDDHDASRNPGQSDLCDGIDNDCDGVTDDEAPLRAYYLDQDNDGYGDDNHVLSACDRPVGYVSDGGDCDDQDPAIHQGC